MCHLKVKSRSADVAMVVTRKMPFSNADALNVSIIHVNKWYLGFH
jgi:hypothetical protein